MSVSTPQPLADYYQQIEAIILRRQHPVTGLLPASTAITNHGDYTDAWVRDNVYSILPVWGLALAYRRLNDPTQQSRIDELEQCVVRLMRGLLVAMMKQTAKVERFKVTQSTEDALHAKYSTNSGDTVVADDEWGHLQLDATSLFLVMLAQMIASGLPLICSNDEVNFVQNLIYYISRAYRTPDYGIWERGNKLNHGLPELNASSVGMAKAALECLNGFNLFGSKGGQQSMVHVISDSMARMRITLQSLLPRESGSKEVDAALLSIISFPAFSVEDEALVDETRDEVLSKLSGKYGCKRFLRDGHQSVLEDTSRLHYDPQELKQFEHIESEWPLFFTYLLLDALFRNDMEQARHYQQKLQTLLVEQEGLALLPELYYVPAELIDAERAEPHSQPRVPNENVPLVWAQGLFLLGQLILDGWLTPADIDPLGRRFRVGKPFGTQVKVAWIAEDEKIKTRLQQVGVASQTLDDIAPVQMRSMVELASVYAQVGKNQRLKLSGRPMRRLRGLAIARLFHLRDELMLFLPMYQNPRGYYPNLDSRLLVERLSAEIAYIQRHWENPQHPLVFVLINEALLNDPHSEALIEWMQALSAGKLDLNAKVGLLTELKPDINCERIDYLHQLRFAPFRWQPLNLPVCELQIMPEYCQPISLETAVQLAETDVYTLITMLHNSHNIYEHIHILSLLWQRKGSDFEAPMSSIARLVKQVYAYARALKYWAVVRRAASLLGKYDEGLEDAVADIIVHQRQVQVGRAYSDQTLISAPMSSRKILQKIQQDGRPEEWVIVQELVLYFSHLLKTRPELLNGMLTLRAAYMMVLITSELARTRNISQDMAFEQLLGLSPYELLMQLVEVLQRYSDCREQLFTLEAIHLHNPLSAEGLHWVRFPAENNGHSEAMDWHQWRETDGAASRLSESFYTSLWRVLAQAQSVSIGDKLDRLNRLESAVIQSEMTPEEKNFALRVEHLLNKIQAADYRHLNIEAILALGAIMEANPSLSLEHLVLDVLIGHAVRLSWLAAHPEHSASYEQQRSAAWQQFYQLPPHDVANAIMQSFAFLLQGEHGE